MILFFSSSLFLIVTHTHTHKGWIEQEFQNIYPLLDSKSVASIVVFFFFYFFFSRAHETRTNFFSSSLIFIVWDG